MIVNKYKIHGDNEYIIKEKLFWNPIYSMCDNNLLVSDIEFIGNGKYRAWAYDVDDQQEIRIQFYIPHHNPEHEPNDWNEFWDNNPEPEIAEEWEKYLMSTTPLL